MTRGPSIEKSITPLRSFVAEPMRHGRLLLAGDAAHYLSGALIDFYRTGTQKGLDGYAAQALARVWKAVRFFWWFTGLTHRFPGDDDFAHKVQLAELDYLRQSRATATALAENYVGLPF
jgi:p-hydroxybenzoate 3-monooxygenase